MVLSAIAVQPAAAQGSAVCSADNLPGMIEGFFQLSTALGIVGLAIVWQADSLMQMFTLTTEQKKALIDAVGRRETDDDIDTYIDRHGVASLVTALTYAVARERGEVTHRLMAEDLDISPLAAEMILQALRPVVHQYFDR